MDSSQDTRTQNGPNLFFIERMVIANSIRYLFFKAVVGVLEDKDNFMEGRAERVLRLSGKMKKIQDMLIFVG